MIANVVWLVNEADGRGLDPNIVRPGWTAMLVVALLGVATYFLARSFIKHTKQARKSWSDDPDAD